MAFFQPTGPGPRTARVKIVMNKRRKFRWETVAVPTASVWFDRLSIDAQRDAVSTYGRDIEITDENGGVRYIP